MFQYSYAYDKLHVTIQTLATGMGDVRSRLVDAFTNFHTLEEDDFPPELQKDWRWVMDQLTKFGPVYDHKGEVKRGSVEHTMGRIKKKTGVRIAEKLVDMYGALRMLNDK